MKIDSGIKEEFAKILGYIASCCLFLILLFSAIYTFAPQVTEDFVGIPFKVPYIKAINSLLLFSVKSINHFSTYIFLAILGIISFIGATQLEEEVHEGEEISHTEKADEEAPKSQEAKTIEKPDEKLPPLKEKTKKEKKDLSLQKPKVLSSSITLKEASITIEDSKTDQKVPKQEKKKTLPPHPTSKDLGDSLRAISKASGN